MGISTHILDTSLGRPASDVSVSLALWQTTEWKQIADARTNHDGRIQYLLPAEIPLVDGLYRTHFETSGYYAAQGLRGLYPYIEIVFEVSASQRHYHIPLLLTAYGYTTYRGT